MIIEDAGIIISIRKFGERAKIVNCLLANHGMQSGIIRTNSKKYSDGLHPGNIVQARWQARIADHLGQYQLEVTHNIAAVQHNRIGLYILNAALAWLKAVLMPRDPAEALYQQTTSLLHALNDDIGPMLHQYAHFELALLQHIGRPLELTRCAATGGSDELVFVSPKSGRAVSKSAGEPYKEKLLHLPEFWKSKGHCYVAETAMHEIVEGLSLTHYFLQRYWSEHYGKNIPEARNMLLAKLGSGQ